MPDIQGSNTESDAKPRIKTLTPSAEASQLEEWPIKNATNRHLLPTPQDRVSAPENIHCGVES